MLIRFILLTFAACSSSNDICGGCFHTCHNGKCDEYGCKPGYYGALCDQSCPINCANGATNKPLCNQTTGACLSGCINGYHGPTCSLNCSRNCLSSLCTQSEGYCVQGCKKHHFGLRCSKDCYNTCAGKQCDRNGLCDSCVNGYWGLFCENQCNPNCVEDVCDMTKHGRPQCSLGCVEGWTGPNCDVVQVGDKEETRLSRVGRAATDVDGKCRQDANGTCTCCGTGFELKDKECVPCENCMTKYYYDEGCFHHCKEGFYNPLNSCKSPCPPGCLHDGNISRCNDADGKCNWCQPGKHGDRCQFDCSGSCENNTCFQNSGYCFKCSKGKYGSYCAEDCSEACEGSICDQSEGNCKLGCVEGWHGHYCNNTCPEGCLDARCSYTIFGKIVCTYGCKDGYWGKDCRDKCDVNCSRCERQKGVCSVLPSQTSAKTSQMLPDSKGSGLSLGLIVTVVLLAIGYPVVFLVWKYKNRKQRERSAAGSHTDNEQETVLTGGQ